MQKPFFDESLWSDEVEIKDFYPYIADGEWSDNIDWNKLDFDDATEYYSKKFDKFPVEIIEILNDCHFKEIKTKKEEVAKKEGKDVVKISKGLFTVHFD